ncbi:hypothetical protein QTP99_11725 [Caldanaerobacter subterraneus KAk]|uniref:hypothetical protein n=1 Tax=Caldanaerobacter subterraneus TaxID=911092 RepID=UPI0032BF9C5D
MRYRFVLLFLLFLSLVFTGCGAKDVGQVNVEETLSLPEKHYPVGFDPYGKRILLAVLGNEGTKLEFYSIKNKEIEIAVEPAINGKSIKNAVTDGKYIAWVEATNDNGMWSDDWRIYVKNLKSGEIKKVGESRFAEGGVSEGQFSVEPKLSIDDGKLVWSTYESDGRHEFSSIKLYNLVNGIEINLRTSEGWNISRFSDPNIHGDYVVWSEGDLKAGSGTKEVYLFCIKENKIYKLSDKGISPNIWGSNVVWIEGNNRLVLYNIKNKREVKIPTYSREVWAISLNKDYVTWYSSESNMKVYNIQKNDTQIINVPVVGPTIYGEILTWVQEEGKRAIPKFLLLYK